MLKFFSFATAGGVMAILLAGCAAIEKQDTKQLLSAAGFNIKPANTPECTAPGFSDTSQRYAASWVVTAAAIQFRRASAGLR